MAPPDETSVSAVARIIQLVVAPVFLFSGIGSFLNVCASRVSRIVDRSRALEPLLLQSKGAERRRWLAELKLLDRRLHLVNSAIFVSVLSAVIICIVVAMLFAATLFEPNFGRAIAWLFIGSMIAVALGFSIFLEETRLATRSQRVRPELLVQAPDDDDQ